MRSLLVVGLMLCVFAAVALGQAPLPMPAPAAPPTPLPEALQTPPPPAPPPVPIAPPSPAQEYLASSPELSVLLSLPSLLGRPLTFLVAFLFVGLVFSLLVRRVILPRSGDAHYSEAPDERTRRRLAIASLVVWVVALFAACEAAGLQWLSSLVQMVLELIKGLLALAGAALGGVFWVVAAMVIAYAISPRGRDFVLGLVGWFYLRHSGSRPKPDQEFDLGGGVRGRLVGTDFLHSTIQTPDGRQQMIPNAWLMKTHFNWDRLPWGAPEAPVVPPPPPPTATPGGP